MELQPSTIYNQFYNFNIFIGIITELPQVFLAICDIDIIPFSDIIPFRKYWHIRLPDIVELSNANKR